MLLFVRLKMSKNIQKLQKLSLTLPPNNILRIHIVRRNYACIPNVQEIHHLHMRVAQFKFPRVTGYDLRDGGGVSGSDCLVDSVQSHKACKLMPAAYLKLAFLVGWNWEEISTTWPGQNTQCQQDCSGEDMLEIFWCHSTAHSIPYQLAILPNTGTPSPHKI